ncbi:glycosyltransferase WbuB, partial [Vibrio cholerae]
LFRITIPSRTQANLAIGKPIVMGVKGDAADLIDMAGAGITCEPNNPQSLADAIQQLVEMTSQERDLMGLNGKNFYYDNLSLQQGVSRFISIFEEIK